MELNLLCEKISEIKMVCYSFPVFQYFSAIHSHNLSKFKPFQLHYKNDESVYFIPYNDSVGVIFGITTNDITDLPIYKVLLQEFVDAQRRVPSAPSISLSIKPPKEIENFPLAEDKNNLVGYLQFSIFILI